MAKSVELYLLYRVLPIGAAAMFGHTATAHLEMICLPSTMPSTLQPRPKVSTQPSGLIPYFQVLKLKFREGVCMPQNLPMLRRCRGGHGGRAGQHACGLRQDGAGDGDQCRVPAGFWGTPATLRQPGGQCCSAAALERCSSAWGRGLPKWCVLRAPDPLVGSGMLRRQTLNCTRDRGAHQIHQCTGASKRRDCVCMILHNQPLRCNKNSWHRACLDNSICCTWRGRML